MVGAALLLALAQAAAAADTVPVCTLVTPAGQNVGFLIGGDDVADRIRLSATRGAVWPTATLRASRLAAAGANLRFAIGAERGLMLELGGLAVGQTQRSATLFRRDRQRPGLPVAFGYCEDRAVDATAPAPGADPAAVGADNPAFNPAAWPDQDCALLLSDGRRARFNFTLISPDRLRLSGADLWSGRPRTVPMRWQQARNAVQLGTFGGTNGPEGVQMMFVEQPRAVKLIRFRQLGEPTMATLTGYGMCSYAGLVRRGQAQ